MHTHDDIPENNHPEPRSNAQPVQPSPDTSLAQGTPHPSPTGPSASGPGYSPTGSVASGTQYTPQNAHMSGQPTRPPGGPQPYSAYDTRNSAPTQPYAYPQHSTPRSGGLTLGKTGLIGLAALLLGLLGLSLFAGWQIRGGGVVERPRSNAPNLGMPSIGNDSTESMREAVVAKVEPAVVQINVLTDRGSSLGSGVIIDKRGYVVTNNHVVEGARRLQVMLSNGTAQPAELVGTAPMDDLAVVKIDPGKTKLTVISLGDSSNLKVGQDVMAIGNPLGITQTVTSGIISALNRNITNPNGDILPATIQTDAAINPGNSGGALVDLQGNLIGIPTLVPIDPQFKTPANGVGFAVPINRVKFIVPQLISSGQVTNTGRASLGAQVVTVDPVLAAQNDLPVDHGVLLADVISGGPAARAGLRTGDIIVQIDGLSIDSTSSLADVLIRKNPGDTVQMLVYRNNQQATISVKLGELSAS